jgi:hypothetical protein
VRSKDSRRFFGIIVPGKVDLHRHSLLLFGSPSDARVLPSLPHPRRPFRSTASPSKRVRGIPGSALLCLHPLCRPSLSGRLPLLVYSLRRQPFFKLDFPPPGTANLLPLATLSRSASPIQRYTYLNMYTCLV